MPSRIYIIFLLIYLCPSVLADVIQTVIEPEIKIGPGKFHELKIESGDDETVELFWQTLAPEKCLSTACIKFEEPDGFSYESFNGQGTHYPNNGIVKLTFANLNDETVSIKITQIKRTCTAEICDLIESTDTQEWKVLRIKSIKHHEKSNDGSYSTLKGVTTTGKEFDIKLSWWFYEPTPFTSCPKFLDRWFKNPKSEDIPYVIAGSRISPKQDNDQFILSVDTCTKNAKNFNAPAESEF